MTMVKGEGPDQSGTAGGCVARVFINPEASETPEETEHAICAAEYAGRLFRRDWLNEPVNTNEYALKTWLSYIGQEYLADRLIAEPIINTDADGVISGIYRVSESRAIRVLINSKCSDGSMAGGTRVQSLNLELFNDGTTIRENIIAEPIRGRISYAGLYGKITDEITEAQKPQTAGQLLMFDFVAAKG